MPSSNRTSLKNNTHLPTEKEQQSRTTATLLNIMQKSYQYLFGPVPSRRFNRSLGVDLTPFKTCTLDCVFCQLGKTTNQTLEREAYVPMDAVLAELAHWLKSGATADYITLSGAGEPTLHNQFGEILQYVKKHSSIPHVLLTNGTLLYLPEVRTAASKADIIKVSLSAWDDNSYRGINRPHADLHFDTLYEGIKTFRAQYTGKIWMEVFLVEGLNALPTDVDKIAAWAKTLSPDRIHLNTAVRPPAHDFVVAVPEKKLHGLEKRFTPQAEVIATFNAPQTPTGQANADQLLTLLRRRPCTADQMARLFNMHPNELAKYTGQLLRNGQIERIRQGNIDYYRSTDNTHKQSTTTAIHEERKHP